MSCIFCSLPEDSYLIQNDSFYVIRDKHPVSKGHLLVISKRHYPDFFASTSEEMADLHQIILAAKEILDEQYSPESYNLGMNCGKHAGQTVFHFHLHIIPRYRNDKGKFDLREYIRELV